MMKNTGVQDGSIGVIVTVTDDDTRWYARVSKAKAARPVQDEWGVFDPAQCGLAAVIEKLEAATDSEDP